MVGFHASSLLWSNWNLEMLVFKREENRTTQRKTLGARQESPTHTIKSSIAACDDGPLHEAFCFCLFLSFAMPQEIVQVKS